MSVRRLFSRLIVSTLLAAAVLPLSAQRLPEADPEALYERLWNADFTSPEEFERLKERAEELGVDVARIFEVDTRLFVDAGLWEPLTEYIPMLKSRLQEGTYPFGQSRIFANEQALRNWLKVLHAQRAYLDENYELFEVWAKEALWSDPGTARFLAQSIFTVHARRQAAEYVVPMETILRRSGDGSEVTVGELLQGRKGLLIDFWATWCGPCRRLMPQLVKKQKKLLPQGIEVAAVNTENDAEKAEAYRREQGIEMTWLVELESRPLAGPLFIDSIPRMVLIDPDGRVRFNGHPQDEALASALAELGVKL